MFVDFPSISKNLRGSPKTLLGGCGWVTWIKWAEGDGDWVRMAHGSWVPDDVRSSMDTEILVVNEALRVSCVMLGLITDEGAG